MTICRKKSRGRRRKTKTRRRRYRRTMKGGGCACASPMVGGRRRRRRRRRKRKTKRRRKRRRKRTRKIRGGGALQGSCVSWKCDMPSNIGHKYTGYKYNRRPFLPDPQNLNTNMRKQYKQSGGGVAQLMNDFGLGDLLLNYYKGVNTAIDVKHRYKGEKKVPSADPMYQPRLLDDLPLPYATPNVPAYYDTAGVKVSKLTIKK